jgi:trigger factor
MSKTEDSGLSESLLNSEASNGEAEEQQERLDLEVKIESRSACERHITVGVPRDEINRYFDKEFSEMMPEVQIPGFRPGQGEEPALDG